MKGRQGLETVKPFWSVLSLGKFGETQEERKESERTGEQNNVHGSLSKLRGTLRFLATNGIYVLNYVACHCNVTITSGYTYRNTHAFSTPSSLR